MKLNKVLLPLISILFVMVTACGNANIAEDTDKSSDEDTTVEVPDYSEGVVFNATSVSGEAVEIRLYDDYLKAILEEKIGEDISEEDIVGDYVSRFKLTISNLKYIGKDIGNVVCRENKDKLLNFGNTIPSELWEKNLAPLAHCVTISDCVADNGKKYLVKIYKEGTTPYNHRYDFEFNLEKRDFRGVIYVQSELDETPCKFMVF